MCPESQVTVDVTEEIGSSKGNKAKDQTRCVLGKKASCEGWNCERRSSGEECHNITPSSLSFAHLTSAVCYLFPAVARTLVWTDTPPHILVGAVSGSPNN